MTTKAKIDKKKCVRGKFSFNFNGLPKDHPGHGVVMSGEVIVTPEESFPGGEFYRVYQWLLYRTPLDKKPEEK